MRSTERRLFRQNEAFEAAINGAPLAEALEPLAHLVAEEIAGDARTNFYLADPDNGRLQPIYGAGDMPDADARWSFPIATREGRAVGTFVMYVRTARAPVPPDPAFIDLVTQTAAIVIARHIEAQERARADAALRTNAERLRRALSVPRVGVLFFDLAGHIHEANAAFEQMSGYTSDELRSTTHWEQLTVPEFLALTSERARDLAEQGETRPYEQQMTRKDGARWWGLFAPTRLSGSGPASECVAFVVDITEAKRAQELLGASEARFRALAESAPVLVWQNDGLGRNVYVNRHFMAFTGRSSEDIGGEGWTDLIHPADAPAYVAGYLAAVHERRPWSDRNRIRRHDGAWRVHDHYAAPLTGSDGVYLGHVGISVDVTETLEAATQHERLAVAEALAAERQALLKRIVQAQEEERARLSRDVHDSLTQLAHAAAMRLDHAVDLLESKPAAARAELEQGRNLARQAAAEARRLIAGLRPEMLDELGITGAVAQEVDSLRAAGWMVELHQGDLLGVRLDPHAEITLFRVAQEALANVRKHAGRSRVRVILTRTDGQLRLEVRDWGRGFDPKQVRPTAQGEQVGLTSMRERMQLLGGKLEVRSGADHGTTVRATLAVTGSGQGQLHA